MSTNDHQGRWIENRRQELPPKMQFGQFGIVVSKLAGSPVNFGFIPSCVCVANHFERL
jgi:hypothetical protein